LLTKPKQYCETLPSRTIEEVFQSHVPTLAYIRAKAGEAAARAAITIIVKQYTQLFSVSEPMEEIQIAITSDLILEDFYYMQLDDLVVCFRNAIKGRYGKIYNRIDPSIVIAWLKQYANDRANIADDISYKEHKNRALQETPSPGGITRQEYLQKLEARANNGDPDAIADLQVARSNEKSFSKQQQHHGLH
jgi:hypothetical protein